MEVWKMIFRFHVSLRGGAFHHDSGSTKASQALMSLSRVTPSAQHVPGGLTSDTSWIPFSAKKAETGPVCSLVNCGGMNLSLDCKGAAPISPATMTLLQKSGEHLFRVYCIRKFMALNAALREFFSSGSSLLKCGMLSIVSAIAGPEGRWTKMGTNS